MSLEKQIIVVGSINTDMVVMTNSFPNPGETLLAKQFLMNLGGKGANQAVAAARLGAQVTFVSKVGSDVFGTQAIDLLSQENIDVSFIDIDSTTNSGVALITVDKSGENTIVVASGANANLLYENTESFDGLINSNTILLMQLEIPISTIESLSVFAKKRKATVVLNPAPAQSLPKTVLACTDILTPNQTEAESITGIKIIDETSAHKAAKLIHEAGPKIVIITMGAKGVYVSSDNESFFMPAFRVNAVDTTAAGDVFNGALVVALSKGAPLRQAVEQACKAAAISVTRIGAQASAPTLKEIEAFTFL